MARQQRQQLWAPAEVERIIDTHLVHRGVPTGGQYAEKKTPEVLTTKKKDDLTVKKKDDNSEPLDNSFLDSFNRAFRVLRDLGWERLGAGDPETGRELDRAKGYQVPILAGLAIINATQTWLEQDLTSRVQDARKPSIEYPDWTPLTWQQIADAIGYSSADAVRTRFTPSRRAAHATDENLRRINNKSSN